MKKVLALAMAFMVFLSGCYTKTVPRTKVNDIDEKIVALMLKEDDKSFIVIGEKYHYIFEPNETFEYIIKNKKDIFNFDMENGYYNLNKKAFARFNVYIEEDKVSKDFIIWALKNGAEKSKEKNNYLKMQIILNGKFYLPNPEVNNSIPKLDKEYTIKIKKQEIIDEKVEVSPIKNVAGGIAVIIGGAFFLAIVIPIYVIGGLTGQNK